MVGAGVSIVLQHVEGHLKSDSLLHKVFLVEARQLDCKEKIRGGVLKFGFGRGMPPQNLNLNFFICSFKITCKPKKMENFP